MGTVGQQYCTVQNCGPQEFSVRFRQKTKSFLSPFALAPLVLRLRNSCRVAPAGRRRRVAAAPRARPPSSAAAPLPAGQRPDSPARQFWCRSVRRGRSVLRNALERLSVGVKCSGEKPGRSAVVLRSSGLDRLLQLSLKYCWCFWKQVKQATCCSSYSCMFYVWFSVFCHVRVFASLNVFLIFFIPCPVIGNRFKYHSDLLSSEFFPESCHISNKALFKWHNLHLFRALSIAISTFQFKRIFSSSYKLREYWWPCNNIFFH